MATFVLLPGAGGSSWVWSRVVPLLREAGHDAVAVDFPGDDESTGLPEYTRITMNAIGDARDVGLVAQSLGGFTAAMVCERVPVTSLVFVNAMIPVPGDTPGAWWDAVGAVDARVAAAKAGGYTVDFDPFVYFLHDLPPDVTAEAEAHAANEADAVFSTPCDFAAWPDVPIRVLSGGDDRFFPVEFQRRVARDRIGVDADVLPGGHLMPLSQPELVAEYLLA